MTATENICQLHKLICLSKGFRWVPANNFGELKVNIATFMLLVWVLFGSECNFNKGVRQVYSTFEMKEVDALKSNFNAEQCRRNTWVILDDGQF